MRLRLRLLLGICAPAGRQRLEGRGGWCGGDLSAYRAQQVNKVERSVGLPRAEKLIHEVHISIPAPG